LSSQVGQGAHVPPQSMPVSLPLSMPSLHKGQGLQLGPQSIPASSPSRMPSRQLAAAPPSASEVR
jgi:hypothetical protein